MLQYDSHNVYYLARLFLYDRASGINRIIYGKGEGFMFEDLQLTPGTLDWHYAVDTNPPQTSRLLGNPMVAVHSPDILTGRLILIGTGATHAENVENCFGQVQH